MLMSSTVCLTRFPFYRYQHFSAFYVILSGGMELDYSRSGHCSPIDEIKEDNKWGDGSGIGQGHPFSKQSLKEPKFVSCRTV